MNEPQGRRSKNLPFGWLKNDNPPCDLLQLPRCRAKAKSTGKRCANPAMKEKRVCWIHGGRSTGPRTPEGRESSQKANFKHGYYTAEAIAERRYISMLLRESRALIGRISKDRFIRKMLF
jgi:hypothetical protein